MNKTQEILVTGGSGQLAGLVINELLKNGKTNISTTTRSPEKLFEFANKGVLVKKADFNEPDSLTHVFDGVSKALLISTDTVGFRVTQHRNAIKAMVKSGVKHLVYTSWPNPDISIAGVSKEHLETEKIIKDSGLNYTILRNFPYAENLFLSLPDAISRGVLVGVAGSGKVAYVTKADCARAAAAALMSSNINKILDITGPEALSYDEVVKMTGEICKKTLNYLDMEQKDFKNLLLQAGLPEAWAELIVSFDLAYKNGDAEKVSSSVFELTGKQPESLRTFLEENKHTLLSKLKNEG